MKQEKSNKISNINLILTLLIVLLHSNCMSYSDQSLSIYNTINYFQIIIQNICCIAVPTFFAISAYLFFNNYKKNDYFSKLKKRIKSLVIPYILWSIIFLLYTIVITNLPFLREINTSLDQINYSFISFIKYILLSTFNGQLWYVFDLFIMVLLTPVIYFFISNPKAKKLSIIIIIANIILNIYFKISYYSFAYWLPIYCVFCYITTNKIDLKKLSKYSTCIFILMFILMFKYQENYIIAYLYRIVSPFFIYYLSNKIKPLSFKPLKINNLCFLTYCMHFNIAVAIKRILIIILGNNPIVLFFLQFVVTFLTLLVIYIFYVIMKKILPNFLNLLSGGRV